jgi:hypothetical protein
MSTFLVVIFSVLYVICGAGTITLVRHIRNIPKILSIAWPIVLVSAACGAFDDHE